MLKKFAIDLLAEVADECDARVYRDVRVSLLSFASEEITEIIENLVEDDKIDDV